MKIAIDAYNLSADTRGMGRIVRTTLRAMVEVPGVTAELVARNATQSARLSREFGIPAPLSGAIRKRGVDAVWYPWNGIRFAAHAPSIVTIHDPFAFTYPAGNPIARLREQRPIRRAIRQAGTILVPSQWTARELQRLFSIDTKRIRVVPNAPDPFWHPVASEAGQEYFLLVTGAEKRKNAGMLLAAFGRAFAKAGPLLVAAGTLSETEKHALRALGSRARAEQPGDERLRELYSGALAVVVPSLAEGFGLPAVEAMACGAAVAASRCAALPETCGDAALLVDPTEDAWTSALQRLADDDALRRDLRSRGIHRAAAMDPGAPAIALLESARRLREGAR